MVIRESGVLDGEGRWDGRLECRGCRKTSAVQVSVLGSEDQRDSTVVTEIPWGSIVLRRRNTLELFHDVSKVTESCIHSHRFRVRMTRTERVKDQTGSSGRSQKGRRGGGKKRKEYGIDVVRVWGVYDVLSGSDE